MTPITGESGLLNAVEQCA